VQAIAGTEKRWVQVPDANRQNFELVGPEAPSGSGLSATIWPFCEDELLYRDSSSFLISRLFAIVGVSGRTVRVAGPLMEESRLAESGDGQRTVSVSRDPKAPPGGRTAP